MNGHTPSDYTPPVHTVRLSPAAELDAALLAAISRAAFHTDVDVGCEEPGGPPGYASAEWQRKMMVLASDYLCILVDDLIAGGAVIFYQGTGRYYLGRVFLDPRYQRLGIGLDVMAQILARYPDARLWTLETPAWNHRTRAFYHKAGFDLVRETADELFFAIRVRTPVSTVPVSRAPVSSEPDEARMPAA